MKITNHNSTLHTPSHKRRGSLYISVMGVTLIVAMIGLSSMMSARVHLKEAANTCYKEEAQHLASSGIELGLHRIEEENDWRSAYTHNVESTAWNLGNGTVTFKFFDDDGNLNDDDSDPVRLIGIGRINGITFQESILLMPTGNGVSCLEAAFHCANSVSLSTYDTVTTNQIFSSNGAIDANAFLAKINGDAEATGAISGNITGTSSANTGVTRQMPGSNVFDYYKTVGTWIPISSIPLDGSDRVIDKAVLCSAINPFSGGTNLEAIYVIDCQSQNIIIKNSRIEATLVLINPGGGSSIRSVNHWEAKVKNYPTLLVDGDMEITMSTLQVNEASQSVNYNPVGFPHDGVTDTDQTDKYSSEIIGLIYVSGQLEVPSALAFPKMTGSVICGTVNIGASFTANYYNTYLDYPPPGFATGPDMVTIPGTRRRE